MLAWKRLKVVEAFRRLGLEPAVGDAVAVPAVVVAAVVVAAVVPVSPAVEPRIPAVMPEATASARYTAYEPACVPMALRCAALVRLASTGPRSAAVGAPQWMSKKAPARRRGWRPA